MTRRPAAAAAVLALTGLLAPATPPAAGAPLPVAATPVAATPVSAGTVATGTAAARATTLTFRMTVSSTGTELTTLPGGHVYGSNRLVGTTTWAGRRAAVVFLALVDYVDGSGPFTGQLTITRADGARLGLTVGGEAVALPDDAATTTRFSGSVKVLGGSGAYAGSTGAGTLTGARRVALGGKVVLKVAVTVLR